ncbi:MAG TPA: hypothetical protein VF763_13570 [Candidatus Limnocylindrales bacterium]
MSPSRAARRPAVLRGIAADWRRFGTAPYRPYLGLALSQAAVASLAGGALTVPLLLTLGASPAVTTLLGLVPFVGPVAQLAVPGLLRWTGGRLRFVTVAAAAIGETRGLGLALVVVLVATGRFSSTEAIVAVGVLTGLAGVFTGAVNANLQAWYHATLPEPERRFVAPRVVGITLGLGAVLLLPVAVAVEAVERQTGPIVYAPGFALAGLAGLAECLALLRLPRPGRVRVPRVASAAVAEPAALRRLLLVATLAAVGWGMGPYLSIYSMSVLGLSGGFAIATSAVFSLTSIVVSTLVAALLRDRSASRLLRVSYFCRGAGMVAGAAALPATAWAAPLVLAIAALMAAGEATGQLATNERIFRLAAGPGALVYQGRYVASNAAGSAAGQVAAVATMALGPAGYGSFAVLFVVSGLLRFVAAARLDVTPTWRSAPDPAVVGAASAVADRVAAG